jgi:rRNA maturation protein Nop10
MTLKDVKKCGVCGTYETIAKLSDMVTKYGFTTNMIPHDYECADNYECYRRALMNMEPACAGKE